jgi:hypothetical protein
MGIFSKSKIERSIILIVIHRLEVICRASFIYKSNARKMSRGSSVSIVSDYGLDDRGSIPDRGRGFFF